MPNFITSVHPETKIDNFSRFDGTITFFSFVKAAMKRVDAKKILDYGAGRGAFYYLNTKETGSLFKRELMDLRTDGAEVWAADIDPVVLTHPASDHQTCFKPGQPLPFEDETFDVIVSEVTFEHIAEPTPVAQELLRVLKSGGYICARTPNKYGYVTIAARLVPNRDHVRFLKWIAPAKKEEDVFPTVFKMNTVGTIKKLFANCEVSWYRESAQPSYYFGNRFVYKIMLGVHALLPNVLATSLCVFIRKPT